MISAPSLCFSLYFQIYVKILSIWSTYQAILDYNAVFTKCKFSSSTGELHCTMDRGVFLIQVLIQKELFRLITARIQAMGLEYYRIECACVERSVMLFAYAAHIT